MLFKEINVLMFKHNISKNPIVFLDVFTKATSNYNTRNKSKYSKIRLLLHLKGP